jgi:hypothetical protein
VIRGGKVREVKEYTDTQYAADVFGDLLHQAGARASENAHPAEQSGFLEESDHKFGLITSHSICPMEYKAGPDK